MKSKLFISSWLMLDTVVRRTALILLGAIGLSLLLLYLLFLSQRDDAFHAQQTKHLADILAGTVRAVDAAPPSLRPDLLWHLKLARMHFEIGPSAIVSESEQNSDGGEIPRQLRGDLPDRAIRSILTESGEDGLVNRLHAGTPLPLDPDPRLPNKSDFRSMLWMSIHLTDGTWLNGVIALRHPGPFFLHPRFVTQTLLSMVLVALIALWAVSRLSQPVKRFAEAADRLGRDVAAPGLLETGPLEFRQAARAFNIMRDRIRRLVEDRTHMLAAISHDLRTPITRLRLRLEFIEDSVERTRMLEDLDEMERLIASTMIFANDTIAQEDRRLVDIATLVQGTVEDFSEMGATLDYTGPHSLLLRAHPLSIKRVVVNLIDNANKYGGTAHIDLSQCANDCVLVIEDSGPGIPPHFREKVFSPFVRLEKSRNRDTGGNGLGLSIARAAVRAHGGDIVLDDSPLGGLRVTVTLPV